MKLMYYLFLPLIFYPLILIAEEQKRIREFDLNTVVQLGQELFTQYNFVEIAHNALKSHHINLEYEEIIGYIVLNQKDCIKVRFIKDLESDLTPAYDIIFKSERKYTFIKSENEILKEDQRTQFYARNLAIQNIHHYSRNTYKLLFLPDIDSNGFLVYALEFHSASDTLINYKPNKFLLCSKVLIIGNSYRFTISNDGKKIEQTDILNNKRTIFQIIKKEEQSKENKAYIIWHSISEKPIETYIFQNLLHNFPLCIITEKCESWIVKNGKIETYKIDKDLIKRMRRKKHTFITFK